MGSALSYRRAHPTKNNHERSKNRSLLSTNPGTTPVECRVRIYGDNLCLNLNLTIRRNAPLEQLGLKNVECRVRIYGDNLCLNLNLTIRRNAPELSLIYLVRYAIEERTLLINYCKNMKQ
jgi:hypothetical protein